jgi:hypothetical protein
LEKLAPKYDVEIKHEKGKRYDRDTLVLYSSRGCVNSCGYCAVPRLEGSLSCLKSIKHILDAGKAELPKARSVVLYDNNFTEHRYFDSIIDELIEFGLPIDIHGLHVDSFTENHAKRLSELKWAGQGKSKTAYIRFSFDKLKYAANIERAAKLVAKFKIRANFFCYMLFNFTDSPHDFWRRLVEIQNIVDRVKKPIVLFPQRYEPLNALKKNQYVGPKWTDETVRGLVKMITRLRGFITINKGANIYRWFGFTKQEFVERMIRMNQENDIDKFTGDIIYELWY